MQAARSALIVASNRYDDERLRGLRAPERDAAELERVLGDPDIGGFDADLALNVRDYALRRQLADFFRDCGSDDTLLVHFSCHGIKDDYGDLYFASPDTDLDRLEVTALSGAFISQLLTRSMSRRIVLLLDCCYSGAFVTGGLTRATQGMDIGERFEGKGRVVLTASNSMEYAFESGAVVEEFEATDHPSVFTSAIVQGLDTGEADRNQDGLVSVDELYEYVFEHVRERTNKQTPKKWVFDVEGELTIARSRYRPRIPSPDGAVSSDFVQQVSVTVKRLDDYASILGRNEISDIRRLAEPLEGKRVLNISASASVSEDVQESLHTLVPLMRSAGVDADWWVMPTHEQSERAVETLRDQLGDEFEFVIVHNPELVPIIDDAKTMAHHAIWQCHTDLSDINDHLGALLKPWLRRFDAMVLYQGGDLTWDGDLPQIYTVSPAIDPLAPKNIALSPADAAYVVDQFGVDVERSLLFTQLPRFDARRDPSGIVDMWRLVRTAVPDVQLALVGSITVDDHQAWQQYNRLVEYADGDPDIFILSNLNNVGSVELNAFQVQADVVVQKSLQADFGVMVAEALWKARPTVAARVEAFVEQIQDGETGWLVDSTDDCAQACTQVLADPDAALQRSLRGKEFVRHKFLMPRRLRDLLELFNRILGTSPE